MPEAWELKINIYKETMGMLSVCRTGERIWDGSVKRQIFCSKSPTTLGYHLYNVRKGGGMKTESTTWHKACNSVREGVGVCVGGSYNPARSLTEFVWNLRFLGC